MSDFRALKGFMNKVYEAGQPFAETRKNYFFDCIYLPNFQRLSLEVADAFHAAEEELVVSINKLGDDDEKKKQYLHEVTAILSESIDFTKFLQVNCHLMLQVLVRSEDVGQGPLQERAFLQMVFAVNLHWMDDLRHEPAFPTLPISSRERIALYQIVGTGAYEAWEALNDEVARQLRQVDSTPFNSTTTPDVVKHNGTNLKQKKPVPTPTEIKLSAVDFNLSSFLSIVSLKPSMLLVINRALVVMGAVKEVSKGTFESIEKDGNGIPFMAVYRKLVDLKEVQDPKTSDGHLKLWRKFFEAQYGAYITTPCSKYGSSVEKFCKALITAEIAIKGALIAPKGNFNP